MTACRRGRIPGGLRRTALAVLLLPLLGACAEKPHVLVPQVAIQAEERANDFSPVALDVVMVRDQKLVDELLKLSAADWFQKRDQYLRDHPEMTAHSWEVVPGQVLSADLPRETPAWAAIVYANYGKGGPHRLRIANSGELKILLGESGPVIAEPKS